MVAVGKETKRERGSIDRRTVRLTGVEGRGPWVAFLGRGEQRDRGFLDLGNRGGYVNIVFSFFFNVNGKLIKIYFY